VNISLIFADRLERTGRITAKKMKTFKNKNWTRRDYESTNVVFCQCENAPNDNWIECDEIEIGKCQPLYTQDGVRYLGYL
jgi:hypothetical protein